MTLLLVMHATTVIQVHRRIIKKLDAMRTNGYDYLSWGFVEYDGGGAFSGKDPPK